MTIETSLAACEETVRRVDPDRYISALFAPSERRPLLFALYALNHELARIGETVKEPMLAAIRFEWWREALEGARDGRPRPHNVVRALAEVFARSGPPLELFETLIAARHFDSGPETFADMEALEAYADATSGALMRIAARLLSEHIPDDAQFRHAGTAYALTGILRAQPFHAARGKSYLPRGLSNPRNTVLARARFHYAAARALPKPKHVLPALLPAALAPLYAKHVETPNSPAADIPLYRRQWAMLSASIRGRV